MNCMHPFTVGPIMTKNGLQSFEVPCGHCTACRIQRTSEWSIRLMHELDSYDRSVFVTLTYDDDHIPLSDCMYATLVKADAQKFMKRLRKALPDRHIKYFLCGEYGDTTFRPHYHAIIFDVSSTDQKIIEKCWTFGYIMVGTVTKDSCKYVTGYVQKKLYGKDAAEYEARGVEPVFKLSSQGLGKNYCLGVLPEFANDDNFANTVDGRVSPLTFTVDGVRHGLPRQYKKWLGVEGSDYVDYIKEREDDIVNWYRKRGYDVDSFDDSVLKMLISDSRKQYNLNLDKRLSMSKKDKI